MSSAGDLKPVAVVDIRDGGTVRYAREARDRARALRDDCLAWFPAWSRRCCRCSTVSPGAGCRGRNLPMSARSKPSRRRSEFDGVWLLNGSYQWGCTTLAREDEGVPWLARTLDWPFSGPWPAPRDRADGRPGGRILQRDLAGLCRAADRHGARPLCHRHEPGAAVATDPPSLAAPVRYRRQCRQHLAAACAIRRPIRSCGRCSNNAAASPRRGGCWRRRRSPGRRSTRWSAARRASVRDRAPGGNLRDPRHRHLGGQRLAAGEATAGKRVSAAGWCSRAPTTRPPRTAARAAKHWRPGRARWSATASAWVAPPVLNPFTRMAVEMCPARGPASRGGLRAARRRRRRHAVTAIGEVRAAA